MDVAFLDIEDGGRDTGIGRLAPGRGEKQPGPSQKTAVPSSPNAAAAATAGFFTAYMNMENLRKSVADEMRGRVFHLHAAAPRGARGAMCQVGGARRIGCRAFPGNGGPVLVIYP